MTASNGVASTQKSTHKAVAGSVGPFTAALTTNGSLYRRLDERAGASEDQRPCAAYLRGACGVVLLNLPN